MLPEKYLLAVIPPPKVANYIDSYRRQYANNTSYTIVPHITIYPPFYYHNSEQNLIKKLNNAFTNTNPFRISLVSIDFFVGKNNVAFFKPDSNSTINLRNLLITTQSHLSGLISNIWPDYPTDPKNFTPHCTIAEHIPDTQLVQVRYDLETLTVSQSFEIKSVFLLKKQQNDWLPISEIRF